MTRARAIVDALIASPGMTMRQVATAIGEDSRHTAVAAQLSQLAKAGKLRRDSAHTGRSGRYWPMPNATQDLRRKYSRDGKRPDRMQAARDERAVSAATPRPETRAQKRARYKSAQASVPRSASQVRIVAPQRPTASPKGRAQTVEEFVAGGGPIERLSTFAASNPLRFDHSCTVTPVGRRRGSVCHKKAGAP